MEILTQSMGVPPEEGSGPQHRSDVEAYAKWAKKYCCARFVMLSSCMHNDLIRVIKDYKTAREMWNGLKLKFGETSATRLHALTLKLTLIRAP